MNSSQPADGAYDPSFLQTLQRIYHAGLNYAISLLPEAVQNSPDALNVCGMVTCALVLYGVYYWIFGDKKKVAVDHWKHSEHFDKIRRETYPPAYPNGWYKLCDLSDLDGGRIQNVSALGLHLIVWRSKKTGQVVVSDAVCPHLGAHLGIGGEVNDKGVVCPFHGWCFGEDGHVDSIPYCDGKLPQGKVLRTYRNRVWLGMVMFWFHCDNHSEQANKRMEEAAPPTYELHDGTSDPSIKNWKPFWTQVSMYRQHIQEMSANSPDFYHFNFLHAKFNFPWPVRLITDRILSIHHDLNLYQQEEKFGAQHMFFNNKATVYVFGIPLSFASQMTVVDMEGPSIIHFHLSTQIGTVHLVKTLLPIDHFKMHVEDKWFRDGWMPLWVAQFTAYIARGALEQDRPVWENKIFLQKPLLVKGDGPFTQFRQWFRQFYSDFSEDYSLENKMARHEW